MTVDTNGLKYDQGLPSWQQKIISKRKHRDDLIASWGLSVPAGISGTHKTVKHIPKECGLLSEKEITITEAPPTVILTNIADRTWTAEEVLEAFISRSIIAHNLTNPLTEIFFAQGVERARELDRILDSTGRVVGPLHGLPVSLKDTLHVAGQETTSGYAAWIGVVELDDDSVVEILRNAGAVLYCKTNVPQTLMSGECNNFVFGRTSSAWNTDLSAGGSSGGEGSLVSLGGSPLGIGGDIAGSIRTPANFNGVYGLCPSTRRFPDHRPEKKSGHAHIKPVYGPISRSVDGLELYTRVMLSRDPWDHDSTVLRLPWREEEYLEGRGHYRKLCFGLMAHDNVVLPDPPIQRCMRTLRNKIVDAGHQIIDIDPFEGNELHDILLQALGATGSKDVWDVLEQSGEPLIKEVVLKKREDGLSAWQLGNLGTRLGVIRQKYHRLVKDTALKTWSGRPVDGIILPSGGTVAPPHGTMEWLLYEAISNVMDWTCATVPVGFVDPHLDLKAESFTPMSDYDQRNYDKYDPKIYEFAPVCLQLMGTQHSEERVLGMLRTLDTIMGRGDLYCA